MLWRSWRGAFRGRVEQVVVTDNLIEKVLEALIEGVGESVVPTDELAEAMIVRGAAALAVTQGRDYTAKLLRGLANGLENPPDPENPEA